MTESRYLSTRWELILLLASATFVVYNLRVCISVAVLEMEDDLNWSNSQTGLVLSSFYWGYAAGQLPSGWLIQEHGAKQLLGISVFMPALLTLLIPAVSQASFGGLLVLCTLRGLFASGTFPSCYYFFSNWIPKAEKTKMVTTVMGGMYLGQVTALSVSDYIEDIDIEIAGTSVHGSSCIFYLFGLLGVAWYPIWQYYAYEYPEDHPDASSDELTLINYGKRGSNFIKSCDNDEERSCCAVENPLASNPGLDSAMLEREVEADDATLELTGKSDTLSSVGASSRRRRNENTLADTIPWGAFVTHPSALVLLFTFFTQNWIINMLLSEIPSYFEDVLGFDAKESGLLSIVPYAVQLAAVVCFGRLFEYLHVERNWPTRKVRQVAQFTAFGGASTGLLLCAFSSNAYIGYMFLVIALAFFGATQSGIGCAFLDVSPNYGSSLYTLANLCGAVAGLASPLIVAVSTSAWKSSWGWQFVFLLTAGLCYLSLFLWYFYQTSDIVPELNTPRKL